MIARYTVVLKTLLDDANVKPLIDKALSTYPMYVPANPQNYSIIPTREQLNTKLLNHYKYREIGFETVGRFLDELEMAMNEIMPYYYQLFKSEDIMNAIEDPFGNVDIIETFEEEREGSSSGSSSGTSSGETSSNSKMNSNAQTTNNTKNVHSKTPQSQLEVPAEEIDTLTYADEVNWNRDGNQSTGETIDESRATSESSNSGESSAETSEKVSHTFKKTGNQGVNTYAHDMKELREIFLNIEQKIINDPRIKELFMLVY